MTNRAAALDKLYGSEPLVIDAHGIHLVRLLNWYNMNTEPEDRRKWIVEYARKRLHYSENDLALLSSAALQMVQTIPHCARALLKGSTFRNQLDVINLIDQTCKETIEKTRLVYNESQEQREQSKMRAALVRKTLLTNAYWKIFDQLENGSKSLDLSVLSSLSVPEKDQIKSYLEKALIEYQQAKEEPEGYEHLNLRSLIKTLEDAIAGINQQIGVVKAQKKTIVRKPRIITAAKQVAKLRYAKEIEGFQSVKPEAILGSNLLFVYEGKTRRLVKFFNPDGTKLTILGSKVKAHSITAKTVRKPSLVLTEMRKGTIKTAERVYDALTTKDQQHGGRMTDQSLILRVGPSII